MTVIERRIDYATVGDRLFVNNVSLGIYATIVQQEGYREAKSETTKALLPEMLGRTQEPFDLQFTDPGRGEVDGAFLIQVSNNPYVLGATLDASQRRRLDTGELGVVAISASTGAEAAQVFTLSALGQRRRSRHWHEFTAERFEVRSRSGKAYAGIDGEALELDTPLEFRIHPRGSPPAGPRREPHRRRAATGPGHLRPGAGRHRPRPGPAGGRGPVAAYGWRHPTTGSAGIVSREWGCTGAGGPAGACRPRRSGPGVPRPGVPEGCRGCGPAGGR